MFQFNDAGGLSIQDENDNGVIFMSGVDSSARFEGDVQINGDIDGNINFAQVFLGAAEEVGEDFGRLSLFEVDGVTENITLNGGDGSANFEGDVTITGNISAANLGGGAEVPDGGTLTINNTSGDETVRLDGENGSASFGESRVVIGVVSGTVPENFERGDIEITSSQGFSSNLTSTRLLFLNQGDVGSELNGGGLSFRNSNGDFTTNLDGESGDFATLGSIGLFAADGITQNITLNSGDGSANFTGTVDAGALIVRNGLNVNFPQVFFGVDTSLNQDFGRLSLYPADGINENIRLSGGDGSAFFNGDLTVNGNITGNID
jgi:hypothetical protein